MPEVKDLVSGKGRDSNPDLSNFKVCVLSHYTHIPPGIFSVVMEPAASLLPWNVLEMQNLWAHPQAY